MNLTACFPGKYIQGQGAIELLEQLIEKFGRRALMITSPSARKYLPHNLSSNRDLSIIYNFGGECSETELKKVSDILKKENAEVIVAMEGGKVIDTGKIAADRSNMPVIVVPTIASTDAPCSGCAVTYTEKGEFEKVALLAKLSDTASYIGITQQSLSRLRRSTTCNDNEYDLQTLSNELDVITATQGKPINRYSAYK